VQGEQWKIAANDGGLVLLRSRLNVMFYGSGNPSTWKPNQRPGDNRWAMTIFALGTSTPGVALGLQMTPTQWIRPLH